VSTEVRVTYEVQYRWQDDTDWQTYGAYPDLPEAREQMRRTLRAEPPKPGERLRIVRVREVTTVTTRVVR